MRIARKKLPHTPPPGVPDGEIFFITICCEARGMNCLATDDVFPTLISATLFYQTTLRWNAHLLLAMPDHLHALISFPRTESIASTVRDWKRWVSKQTGIKWQHGFFDHRLRADESFDEKAHYIRMNPVRAGLAEPDSWKYIWLPGTNAAR